MLLYSKSLEGEAQSGDIISLGTHSSEESGFKPQTTSFPLSWELLNRKCLPYPHPQRGGIVEGSGPILSLSIMQFTGRI